MVWETPAVVEINMSAEINAYQEDSDRDDEGF
jgi:coenzyme PQQ precursor peptide PqqA